MLLSRRAVLAVIAGGVLTSCADPEPATRPTPTPTPPLPTPPPTTTSAATTPAVPVVTREEIVGRYAGAQPAEWGLEVTGVVRTLPTTDSVVALTFDACGGDHGSGYDQALIDTLRQLAASATLFVNARWVGANPALFAELAADPLFEIANHGTRHLPLSVSGQEAYGIAGTLDAGEVYDEVAGNRDTIAGLLGRPPRFFRSGTAHCDEVAAQIAVDLGSPVVNFDVNGDGGATFAPEDVESAVLTAGPGSIVIAHMNQPDGGTAEGMAAAIPQLIASGLQPVQLSDYL